MSKALTAAAVSKLRPESTRREVPDGGCPGLYLVISPSGVKSWALRYRRPQSRKTAKLVLGRAIDHGENTEAPAVGDFLSLGSARLLAAKLRHEVATGRDPAKQREKEKSDTFPLAARNYLDHARKNIRRWQSTAELLGLRPDGTPIKGGLAEAWKHKAITEIDEDDIFHALDEAGRRATSRKRVMFAALSSFFNYLKVHRKIKHNPVKGLKRPPAAKPRERVLEDDEIGRFWQACNHINPLYAAVFRLLLLTGARLREIADLQRSEITEDGKMIRLPGTRTKNHRQHDIPLSPLAQQILSGFLDGPKLSEFIFTTTNKSSISGWSKVKKQLDLQMNPSAPWRLHDLRRTAVTGMARSGADLPVIERAVNHVSGSFGGIVSTYQKHKFSAEVKASMDSWESLLKQILSSESNSNIICLKKIA